METLTTTRQVIASGEASLTHSLEPAFSVFNGIPVTRGALLRHVLNVSRHLPDGGPVLNLCRDRYFFIVAFLAALLKNQPNLLPPNHTPRAIAQLLQNYPHSYCITDHQDLGQDRAWLLKAEYFDGDGGDFPDICDAQTAAVSFTSGSTGQPKAVSKTWGEFRHAARLALRQLGLLERELHMVSTAPPQHMYGLETSLFWPLDSHLTIDNRQPFFPEDIRRVLTSPVTNIEAAGLADRPCLLVSTPTHLKACVEAGLSWRNVALVLSSTGPLSLDLAQAVERSFNAPLLEIFGSTETQSFASRRLTASEKWTPYTGIHLSGGDGVFQVSGGHLPEAVELDDQFEIGADGRFTIAGRSSEIVKVAGKRASLAELNLLLNNIDGVGDGVFFRAANERLGALVVTQLSKQCILAALKPALDPVFLPRPLYRVARLPRNELGKLDRKQLQELIDVCKQRRDL